jgi:hypothetical protein
MIMPETSAAEPKPFGSYEPAKVEPVKPEPVKNEPVAKTEPAKFLKVNNAFSQQVSNDHTRYPFDELEVGQGMFVSNDDYLLNHRSTVVQLQPSNVPRNELLEFMRKEIYCARDYYGIIEHDIDGNEVWEDVNVRVRENRLDSSGNPVIGSNIVHRPKMIYSRFFSAYEVKKDAQIGEGVQAPADGVLVIREA